MTDYLMAGTVGLDVDAWQGSFYDEDLPVDWRAASYSSLLRSVLLPEHEWKKAIEEDWAGEVDEEFRFVLRAGLADIEMLLALPEDMSEKVAGAIIEILSLDVSNADRNALSRLSEQMPICLDSTKDSQHGDEIDSICRQLGLSRVWYPSVQNAPLESGRLLVVILSDEDLSQQREIVSVLDAWMKDSRTAGVFHDSLDNAPERAQQTRLLAEMMGV